MDPTRELDAWQDWRRICALAGLDVSSRHLLEQRITERFRSRLKQLAQKGLFTGETPDARDCGHLFETHCLLHHRRDGKRYKDWLVDRGRQDLDTVQSGVMLLLRNVVKDWLKEAYPQTAELSLQRVLGDDLTLEALLPAEEKEGEAFEEMRAWLNDQQDSWLDDLHPVEVWVLRFRYQGRILSDPASVAEAGVGKTTLHDRQRHLYHRWAEALKAQFPDAEPASASRVLLELMDRAGAFLCKEHPEKPDQPAFGRQRPSS